MSVSTLQCHGTQLHLLAHGPSTATFRLQQQSWVMAAGATKPRPWTTWPFPEDSCPAQPILVGGGLGGLELAAPPLRPALPPTCPRDVALSHCACPSSGAVAVFFLTMDLLSVFNTHTRAHTHTYAHTHGLAASLQMEGVAVSGRPSSSPCQRAG